MAQRNQAAQGCAVGSRQGVSSARRARPRRVRLPLVRRRDRALDFEGPHSPRRRLECLFPFWLQQIDGVPRVYYGIVGGGAYGAASMWFGDNEK